MTRGNSILRALCLVIGVLALPACSSSGGASFDVSDSQAQQIRRTAEHSNAVPIQMLLTVGTPTDSTGNRYVDTLPVMVYLFPVASESRLPVWSPGTFRFELHNNSGELLTSWEFSEKHANAARVSLSPGPGYSFYLRFAEGLDRGFTGQAGLNGIFIHENGSAASSNGVATVRLGNR